MPGDNQVIHALLGVGTRYEGKLFFDGRVRVDGDFRGEVHSEGVLVVGEQAELRGVIRVGILIVRGGKIWGEVHATELVELHAPSEVHGDIHTPALFIDQGVVFEGSCAMGKTHPLRPEPDSADRPTPTAGVTVTTRPVVET